MPTPAPTIKVRVYLMSKPNECTTGASLDAVRGISLSGRDTSGLLVGDFGGQWLGPQALDFLKTHREELVPGRCVDLEITHIKSLNSKHFAQVQACELAPKAPSWIKHEEKLSQTTTEKQTS